jgi:exodeoxyribonuclease VII large subunit
MSNKRLLTVTALTRYIKKKFDVDSHLHDVWLKAELSNVKIHSRGHIYFTLKDENARIQAVMFAANNQHLSFKPENGQKVIVRGEISVYEPYGTYQMYVNEMQLDGIGSLYLKFEELKKSLHKQGMFDHDRKKPLPRYPEVVGVITSPTGAAIRDIYTTIKRRYATAKVILIPALVQGESAASSIVAALNKSQSLEKIDVLIVGRGGGSIEDLWPFNEEAVARAMFDCTIPIISAVGHETDFTIADFVADLRAPTPTGAAELAVPHILDLTERINERERRLYQTMKERLLIDRKRLQQAKQSYAFRFPRKLSEQKEQQLDRLLDQLGREMMRNFDRKQQVAVQLSKRLHQQHPQEGLWRSYEKYNQLKRRSERAMLSVSQQKQQLLGQALSKLNALNPLNVMERGYSLVYKTSSTDEEPQKLIKSVEHVAKGEQIKIQMKDGSVDCQVIDIEGSECND